MEINVAHIREQGFDFIVFDADASARTREARAELLADLVDRERADGLHVDKAALAYRHGGRIEFLGTPTWRSSSLAAASLGGATGCGRSGRGSGAAEASGVLLREAVAQPLCRDGLRGRQDRQVFRGCPTQRGDRPSRG